MGNNPAHAFIGIGSNLGRKKENVFKAISSIDELNLTDIIKTSSLYKTEPVGFVEQGWFVNAVIKVETGLAPLELMSSLQELEERLGRVRAEKWRPRIIDLDILFYDKVILSEKGVMIPHPLLQKRKFVLIPFCEIEPEFVHPVLKRSISTLNNELDEKQDVIKI